jgi:hypothetical protein
VRSAPRAAGRASEHGRPRRHWAQSSSCRPTGGTPARASTAGAMATGGGTRPWPFAPFAAYSAAWGCHAGVAMGGGPSVLARPSPTPALGWPQLLCPRPSPAPGWPEPPRRGRRGRRARTPARARSPGPLGPHPRRERRPRRIREVRGDEGEGSGQRIGPRRFVMASVEDKAGMRPELKRTRRTRSPDGSIQRLSA